MSSNTPQIKSTPSEASAPNTVSLVQQYREKMHTECTVLPDNSNQTFHPFSRLPPELRSAVFKWASQARCGSFPALYALGRVNSLARTTSRNNPKYLVLQSDMDYFQAESMLKRLLESPDKTTTAQTSSIVLTLLEDPNDRARPIREFTHDNLLSILDTIRGLQISGHFRDLEVQLDPEICPASPLFSYHPTEANRTWNNVAKALRNVQVSNYSTVGGDVTVELKSGLKDKNVSKAVLDNIDKSTFPATCSMSWVQATKGKIGFEIPDLTNSVSLHPSVVLYGADSSALRSYLRDTSSND